MNFFSIRRKIFLSFLSIIVLYVGITLTGYYFLNQARNLTAGMEPRTSQRTFLYEFTISLSSLETSLDKFFVVGYPAYQEKVNENLENMLDILKTLKRDADKDLISELSELENLISELREDTVFLREAGAGRNERIISIYQKMDIVREKSREMLSEITGQIFTDIREQKRLLSVVINEFIILGIFLLVMGVVISLYLSRLISGPITEAKNAAIEVGKGNLDVKFEVKAKDEIGELALAFGQMTSDLKKSRKELEEYSKTLEEKVAERTKELEEAKKSLEIKVKARTKELEEEKASLEGKVKERTKDLEQKYTQLEFQRNELDKTTKMLIRRDFELSELRERREPELKELKKRTEELEESKIALTSILEDIEDSRRALMNMLEDAEDGRKKVEEEKNKTVTIIKNLADGLLVFDQGNKLSLINFQAEIFFQMKTEKVIGKSLPQLAILPIFKPLAELLLKETAGIFRRELQLKENLILEISTIPLATEKEKLGKLVVLHDITREKVIEKMKTEFVSLTAHQLRTPLSAIKWTLRILLDGDLGEITSEQKDFLEKTYQSNERMISLINDLLNVTRIEEGRYLGRLTLVDIEEVINLVVNSHKDEIERRKIKFEFKKPKEKIPQIMVDAEKMGLVVQNLLDNAIHYTRPGGEIIISLNTRASAKGGDERNSSTTRASAKGGDERSSSTTRAQRRGGEEDLSSSTRGAKDIEFSIKDTGTGIPEGQQERIFTKFFRGTNAIKMEADGSGLGLFIAKNIIDAHKGKIWFESKQGEGTTFYFNIPIHEKEEFTEFLTKF